MTEETGYSARKWTPLVEYYASPGFLGESMKVFIAEGLVAGDAHPEADEDIDFRLVKLSDVLKMIEKGAIQDGIDMVRDGGFYYVIGYGENIDIPTIDVSRARSRSSAISSAPTTTWSS